MAPVMKKKTGNAAEAPSEPGTSENRTPNSFKPKPKISKKALVSSLVKANKLNGTQQAQGKKSKKKVTVSGSKNITSTNKNEDAKNLNTKDMKQKSPMNGEHGDKSKNGIKIKEKQTGIISGDRDDKNKDTVKMKEKQKGTIIGEHDDKNKGIIQIKEKGDGLQTKQHNEKNREKQGGLENKRGQKNKVHGGLQKKQLSRRNKGKFNGLEKNESRQTSKQTHDQVESTQKKNKKEKLGGLIFMCNGKTKPDCFHYRVMGVPMSKKDLVLGVKPGLKLFLYDFDLRLMYGIYKATSSGGMKLEPEAFNGAFPVQVRFSIHQDCYPLPESVFQRAIKENYNEKNKFDTELTVQQVKNLIRLFRPAEVPLHASYIRPPPMVTKDDWEFSEEARESRGLQHREPVEGRRYPVLSTVNDQHLTHRKIPSAEKGDFPRDYFLSEKEYRTYGLPRERENITSVRGHVAPTLEPRPEGHAREHLLIHPGALYRDAASAQGQIPHHDPYLATERKYLTHGLFPGQELQSLTPLATTTVASTVDSYPKVPHHSYRLGGSFVNADRPPSRREDLPLGSLSHRGRGETYLSETVPLRRRETYLPQNSHSWRGEAYLTETNHLGRRESNDVGRLYSTYASNALSEYNQIHHSQEPGPETSLAPVSSRYTFAGPSLSHR